MEALAHHRGEIGVADEDRALRDGFVVVRVGVGVDDQPVLAVAEVDPLGRDRSAHHAPPAVATHDVRDSHGRLAALGVAYPKQAVVVAFAIDVEHLVAEEHLDTRGTCEFVAEDLLGVGLVDEVLWEERLVGHLERRIDAEPVDGRTHEDLPVGVDEIEFVLADAAPVHDALEHVDVVEHPKCLLVEPHRTRDREHLGVAVEHHDRASEPPDVRGEHGPDRTAPDDGDVVARAVGHTPAGGRTVRSRHGHATTERRIAGSSGSSGGWCPHTDVAT